MAMTCSLLRGYTAQKLAHSTPRALLARNRKSVLAPRTTFPWSHTPSLPRIRTLASNSPAGPSTNPLAPPAARSNSVRNNESQDVPQDPQVVPDEARVAIHWEGGISSSFDYLWLRDHCRCQECFHPKTKQRLVDTFAIPENIKPSGVSIGKDGLELSWPSDTKHISVYPWDWLLRNSYNPAVAKNSGDKANDPKVLWGSRILKDLPTVMFNEVMREDQARLNWLQKIDRFGFCFIHGVPHDPESTERLAQRIAHIRYTHYGGFWDFTSNLAYGDLAYTNSALAAHTDTTYFTDPCGLQLFHLLEHSGGTGGATLLVDGFYVASILKELDPEAYKVLSRVRVPTHAAGDDTIFYRPGASLAGGSPILVHAPRAAPKAGDEAISDDLIQVRYNNEDRSVMTGIDSSLLMNWYRALKLWNKCLTSPDSELWVQLSPGTAVVVDNHRVLHGRSAFTGRRRMCGAYIGADDFQSTLAALGSPAKSVWDPRL